MNGKALMRKNGSIQFVKVGVPFILFAVLGSFGLSRMLQGRLDVKDAKQEVNDFRAPVAAQRKRRKMKKCEQDFVESGLEVSVEYEMKEVPRPKGAWW